MNPYQTDSKKRSARKMTAGARTGVGANSSDSRTTAPNQERKKRRRRSSSKRGVKFSSSYVQPVSSQASASQKRGKIAFSAPKEFTTEEKVELDNGVIRIIKSVKATHHRQHLTIDPLSVICSGDTITVKSLGLSKPEEHLIQTYAYLMPKKSKFSQRRVRARIEQLIHCGTLRKQWGRAIVINATETVNFSKRRRPRPHALSAMEKRTQSIGNDLSDELDDIYTDNQGFGSRMESHTYRASNSSSENIQLHPIQKYVLDLVCSKKKSVFFTGPAGTGKSLLLKKLIKSLKTGRPDLRRSEIFVTGSTGMAAMAIGGVTIHSFAGVGRGSGTKEYLLNRVQSSKKAKKNWQNCKVLIIDEISMIDAELWDALEFIARNMKSQAGIKDELWGGIQVIATGDFYQLPPVKARGGYAFQSNTWETTFPPSQSVILTKVFRQQGDELFLRLLSEVRIGRLSPDSRQLLNNLVKQGKKEKYKEQTSVVTENEGKQMMSYSRLFAKNKGVEKENEAKLQELPGRAIHFRADDTGNRDSVKALNYGSAPEILSLKKGCEVVLLKNLNSRDGLINGARGTVVGFQRPNKDGHIASHILNELRGKSSAQTVKPVGQPSSKIGGKLVCEKKLVPVVKFVGLRSTQSLHIIERQDWKIENAGQTVATRSQIPLKLAWALSIHKSQGMTLQHVELELAKCFEAGQAYVALSRGTSLNGIRLLSFTDRCIKTSRTVQNWYDTLAANCRAIDYKANTQDNVHTQDAQGIENFGWVNRELNVKRKNAPSAEKVHTKKHLQTSIHRFAGKKSATKIANPLKHLDFPDRVINGTQVLSGPNTNRHLFSDDITCQADTNYNNAPPASLAERAPHDKCAEIKMWQSRRAAASAWKKRENRGQGDAVDQSIAMKTFSAPPPNVPAAASSPVATSSKEALSKIRSVAVTQHGYRSLNSHNNVTHSPRDENMDILFDAEICSSLISFDDEFELSQ